MVHGAAFADISQLMLEGFSMDEIPALPLDDLEASMGGAVVVGQQQAGPGSVVPVPQVVASYAAYLRTRTRAEPQVSVAGDRAQVGVSVRGKTLVLAFQVRRREWSLDGAELRCGEQVAAFGRHELTRAVTALLAA